MARSNGLTAINIDRSARQSCAKIQRILSEEGCIKESTKPTQPPIERAFLVGVELKHARSEFSAQGSLDELAQLAMTAGAMVVGRASQKIARINPATYIGKGKLEELVGLREELAFDVLIFDEELHPNQQRDIEEAFGKDIKYLTAPR